MSYLTAEKVVASLLRSAPDRTARVPPHLVVAFDRDLFEAIRSALDARPAPDWLYADRPARRLYVAPDRPRLALLHTEIGAPLISFLLELLASCGLRSVLLVTSAGAVAPDLPVGSLFVIDSAVSENGVTAVLAPERREFLASPAATARVEQACARVGVPAPRVRTLSSDLYFRESPRFWSGYQPRPAVVEMEAAAVFATADRCGLDAAAVGYVADVLAPEWTRARDGYYPARRLRLVEVVRAFADDLDA